MSKTIDERLDTIHSKTADAIATCLLGEADETRALLDERATAKASIIAGWNAAEKAMKFVVSSNYFTDIGGPWGDRWQCETCGDADNRDRGRHTPELCSVAAAQAALVLMEGHSHSRDEAMVENKRYERDDIYKK